MMKSKVYFTREITPESVVAIYHKLGVELPGRVAVKVHTGEQGNQNFLRPEFWKPVIEAVNGTVVECNTAYEGQRDSTEKHKKTMESTAGAATSPWIFWTPKGRTSSSRSRTER